jgi:hypothetical protein
MRTRFAFSALALVIALGGCAQNSQRCTPPDGGDASRSDRGFNGPRSVSASVGSSYVVDETQQSLSETVAALHLTPRQQVLWDAFQTRIGDLMADRIRGYVNTPSGRTAVQQIDSKVDTVRNRLAAMEDIADAAKALYASLDQKQKETADLRLAATVPALYSGFGENAGGSDSPDRGRRSGPGGGGGPGGGMMGGPDGGM